MDTNKEPQFNFQEDLDKANKIENLDKRLLFLKKRLKEYKQYKAANFLMEIENKELQYNEEIKYINELIKIKPISNHTNQKQVDSIWWQKSNRLLGYLIEELARLGYIEKETDINRVIKDHFLDKNKNPFTDSIRQNRSGSGNNSTRKPKGSEKIDSIINKLKE